MTRWADRKSLTRRKRARLRRMVNRNARYWSQRTPNSAMSLRAFGWRWARSMTQAERRGGYVDDGYSDDREAA